ncbi:hypothetical protein M758_12G116700 [Ceratodon purpureus]|nr:hypothetical protein M758_12G116700 [Ceratodon purpureus]
MKLTVTSMLLVAMILAVKLQVAISQDSFNCGGSTLCSGPLISQQQCDEAKRKIVATTRYFTGGSSQETGVCSGHCGLFVGGGSNCDLTGQEMLDAFSELRIRECAKCGVKTYNDACQFKMDYVASC